MGGKAHQALSDRGFCLLLRLAWKAHRQALVQTRPLLPLKALVNSNTENETYHAQTGAGPQGQHKHTQQQSDKRPYQYTVDNAHHSGHRKETLQPGSTLAMIAHSVRPIIIG